MADFDERDQEKKINELHTKEAEELARILSQKYGVEYIDLSLVSINTDALQLISEERARLTEVAIFNKIGKKLSLAARAPGSDVTRTLISELEGRGYNLKVFMVSRQSLERAWARYGEISLAVETKAGVLDISGDEIQNLLQNLKSLTDVRKLIEETLNMKKAYRISRILEIVLAAGLSSHASDVHIEPEEAYVRLRFRLDGVLTDIIRFDRETYGLLLSRIKLISGLKLNIRDEAQDGRFSLNIDTHDIEIRTSLLPGAYGESIVLRVLDPISIALSMEELGVHPSLLELLEAEIKKPNGMILNTGPTGSGKTTTLYAFLKKIHRTEIKIITIEDPIEYHLPGIVQTQTDNEEYTFEKGLRSALRQDPDIIMVGEIRDGEVAETAINAALTGHLVFSTLHTNEAAGSFPRLIDLGVNPKVISSAVNLAMAQRLVRVLCLECREEIELSRKQLEHIDKTLADIKDPSLIPQNHSRAYRAVGCSLCNDSGYKGRIGIFELILMDETIEKLVQESASEHEIAKAAKEVQGLLSMREDGILKVLSGVTTLEEIDRVMSLSS